MPDDYQEGDSKEDDEDDEPEGETQKEEEEEEEPKYDEETQKLVDGELGVDALVMAVTNIIYMQFGEFESLYHTSSWSF